MTRWGMCQVDVLCACVTTYKSVIKNYGILILPFIYLVSPRKTLELWSQLWNAEYLLLWMSENPMKKVLFGYKHFVNARVYAPSTHYG